MGGAGVSQERSRSLPGSHGNVGGATPLPNYNTSLRLQRLTAAAAMRCIRTLRSVQPEPCSVDVHRQAPRRAEYGPLNTAPSSQARNATNGVDERTGTMRGDLYTEDQKEKGFLGQVDGVTTASAALLVPSALYYLYCS